MQPGSYVTLRNAKIDMFRGSMRLAVNQVGAAPAAPAPACVLLTGLQLTGLGLEGTMPVVPTSLAVCHLPALPPQWGKIEAATGQSFKARTDFNLSLVEYELVPVSGCYCLLVVFDCVYFRVFPLLCFGS